MTFSARDRKRATAVTASMNVETTWRLATRGNTCVVRATGGRVVSESKGLRFEERRRSNGLERVGESCRRSRGWNTNMRIKAVEGIKAYSGADLSRLRLSECLSVYSIVLRVSIHAFVNRFRLSCEQRISEYSFFRLQVFA